MAIRPIAIIEIQELSKVVKEINVVGSPWMDSDQALLWVNPENAVKIKNIADEKINQNQKDQWGNDEEAW